MRPCIDNSGESDFIICTPNKILSREKAKECCGIIYDEVWQGWIKHGKSMLRRVGINNKKCKKIAVGK